MVKDGERKGEREKKYREKEASDKRGKARNLSIKSSTKACSGHREGRKEKGDAAENAS